MPYIGLLGCRHGVLDDVLVLFFSQLVWRMRNPILMVQNWKFHLEFGIGSGECSMGILNGSALIGSYYSVSQQDATDDIISWSYFPIPNLWHGTLSQ